VGSNPTRSISFNLVNTVLLRGCFLVVVGQIQQQCLGEVDGNKFLVGYLTIIDS
jgi:hypothetical protein